MEDRKPSIWIRGLQGLFSTAAAVVITLGLFLILPLMQTIGNPIPPDLEFRGVDAAQLPPPPPPPAEEEPEPEEEPEQPPELLEEAPPLDLAQLELALNPDLGEGLFGDFTVQLTGQMAGGSDNNEMDKIFSLADLDQRPRAIFQRAPSYPSDLRKRNRRGTVYIVFQVDKQGKVVNPRVEKSTDPAFDRSALEAVRQWKFEPGTRNGEKVTFRMRVPITFNAG
jgi:protein TonB